MTPQAAAATARQPADKPVFDWQDALLLDDQLSEEERMLRDSARDFCQEKLMPRVLEANRHERFHREIMNEMRSEEHTSELQSHSDLVCRLLLEKKKKKSVPLSHLSNCFY